MTRTRHHVYLGADIGEHTKNTSASSGVTESSAISSSCNPGVFDSGATAVLSPALPRHRTPLSRLPPTPLSRLPPPPPLPPPPTLRSRRRQQQQQQQCINANHAAGRLPDAITWSDTRAAAGLKPSCAPRVTVRSGGRTTSIGTKEPCGAGLHRNRTIGTETS